MPCAVPQDPTKRSVVTRSVALGLAATMICAAGPASANDFRALYEVAFAGLTIARASIAISLSPERYASRLDFVTSGVARLVDSSRTTAQAEGLLKADGVVPEAYRLAETSKSAADVKIDLENGSVVRALAVPPLEDMAARVPVTLADRRHVIDPLSAVVMPVPRGKDPFAEAACDRHLPVYDGWTRYDVVLAFRGLADVSAEGYSGKALVCSARWVPVAGHRPDKESTKFLAANRDMEIWLVPAMDSRILVPFHVAIKTITGSTITVDARKVEGVGAVQRAAMGGVRPAVSASPPDRRSS